MNKKINSNPINKRTETLKQQGHQHHWTSPNAILFQKTAVRKESWHLHRTTGNLQSSFQNQHPIHDRQLLPELFNNLEGTHEMSSKTQIMKHEAVVQLF